MTKNKSYIIALAATYCALLSIFTLLSLGVALIPHKSIEANCQSSIAEVYSKGTLVKVIPLPLTQLDTFTDMVMLNLSYCSDETQPAQSSMISYFHVDEQSNPFESAKHLIDNKHSTHCHNESYSSYWHGHQVLLKPLLVFFSYHQIILINTLLFLFLMLICLYLAWQRLSFTIAMLMLASWTAVAFFVAPLCFQFTTCFVIMFISTSVVLAVPQLTDKNTLLMVTFMSIGAFTSFFDFLTTPQLTLVYPLACCLLLMPPASSPMPYVKLFLGCFSWALGYASLWISKSLVAWGLTGQDTLTDFVNSLIVRSSAGLGQIEADTAELAYRGSFVIAAITLTTFIIVLSLWLLDKRKRIPAVHQCLLLSAMIVPLWYVLTLQHSTIHYWFTWRASSASLFCLLLYLYVRKRTAA